MSVGSTSTSLLERVKLTDQEAWRQLASLYAPLVYHWCRSRYLLPDDSSEVVQEVFCAVFQGIKKFHKTESEGSFRAWLNRITRNKIADRHGELHESPRGVGGDVELHALQSLSNPDPSSNSEIEPEPRIASMQAALLQLGHEVTNRDFQIFWKTSVEEKSAAEVAESFGMSDAAVYKVKSRLLSRLREILAEINEENLN